MRLLITISTIFLLSSPAFAEELFTPYKCTSFGTTGFKFNKKAQEWEVNSTTEVKKFEVRAKRGKSLFLDPGAGLWEVFTLDHLVANVVRVCSGNFSEEGILACGGQHETFYFDKDSGVFNSTRNGFYNDDATKGGLGPKLFVGMCEKN